MTGASTLTVHVAGDGTEGDGNSSGSAGFGGGGAGGAGIYFGGGGGGGASLGSAVSVSHGAAGIRLSCSGGVAGASCRGVISLSTRVRVVRIVRHRRIVSYRTLVVGSARYQLPSGQVRRDDVRLTAAGRAVLKSEPDHRLRAQVTITLSGGAPVTRQVTLALSPAHGILSPWRPASRHGGVDALSRA